MTKNKIPYYDLNDKGERIICPICNKEPDNDDFRELEHLNGCDYDKKNRALKCKQRDDFKLRKQSYDDDYPKTVICINCGNDKFTVGKGSLYTALKCPVCGVEVCIHEG